MCTGFHVKIIFCRMQTKGTSTWPRLEKGANANSEMASVFFRLDPKAVKSSFLLTSLSLVSFPYDGNRRKGDLFIK